MGMDMEQTGNHNDGSTGLGSDMPLITVVTVVYNAAAVLERTILSVLSQTYPRIEYIIIDGGSDDGSVDIIQRYSHSLAYWCSRPDNGIYDAMNEGICKATGEWINFMNAGDTFCHEKVIEKIFSGGTDRISGYDVLYGNTIYRIPSISFMMKPDPLESIVYKKPFCHQASFIKACLLKLRKFDESYKISADYESFLYFYQKGCEFRYIDEEFACYDCTDSISAKNEIQVHIEDSRINGRYSQANLICKKIKYCLYNILKKIYKLFVPEEQRLKIKVQKLKKLPNVEWVKLEK